MVPCSLGGHSHWPLSLCTHRTCFCPSHSQTSGTHPTRPCPGAPGRASHITGSREDLLLCTSWSTCSPAHYSPTCALGRSFQTCYGLALSQVWDPRCPYSFPLVGGHTHTHPAPLASRSAHCPPGRPWGPPQELSALCFPSIPIFWFLLFVFLPSPHSRVEFGGLYRPGSSAVEPCLQSLPVPCLAFKPEWLRALGL